MGVEIETQEWEWKQMGPSKLLLIVNQGVG